MEDRLGSADAKGAFGALFELGEAAFDAVQELKGARNVLKDEFAPLLCEFHPLMHAVEKRRAELIFELTDRLRDGGLGNIQLLRRLGEAPALCDRVKDAVKFQIDHILSLWRIRNAPRSLAHTEFGEDLADDLLGRRLAAQEPQRLVGAFEVLGIEFGGKPLQNGGAGS